MEVFDAVVVQAVEVEIGEPLACEVAYRQPLARKLGEIGDWLLDNEADEILHLLLAEHPVQQPQQYRVVDRLEIVPDVEFEVIRVLGAEFARL